MTTLVTPSSLTMDPSRAVRPALVAALSAVVVAWTFLEASLWWMAPDISICIAWVHAPRHWRRFLALALGGALIGSAFTYAWAHRDAAAWEQSVMTMRFHSLQNLQRATAGLASPGWSIVKGAWQGIPYKLYFGAAGAQGAPFWPLALWGLLSRALRFSFSLAVTVGLRAAGRPWTTRRPWAFSAVLMGIWFAMIALFDVVINAHV